MSYTIETIQLQRSPVKTKRIKPQPSSRQGTKATSCGTVGFLNLHLQHHSLSLTFFREILVIQAEPTQEFVGLAALRTKRSHTLNERIAHSPPSYSPSTKLEANSRFEHPGNHARHVRSQSNARPRSRTGSKVKGSQKDQALRGLVSCGLPHHANDATAASDGCDRRHRNQNS